VSAKFLLVFSADRPFLDLVRRARANLLTHARARSCDPNKMTKKNNPHYVAKVRFFVPFLYVSLPCARPDIALAVCPALCRVSCRLSCIAMPFTLPPPLLTAAVIARSRHPTRLASLSLTRVALNPFSQMTCKDDDEHTLVLSLKSGVQVVSHCCLPACCLLPSHRLPSAPCWRSRVALPPCVR
jgi:hypothetical protein